MSADAPLADAAARARIRDSLDESLLVEAAAGTGKTSELVARAVAVLRSGRGRVERLAAVTFSRKAAGELKLRLRFELDAARRAAGDDEERARLQDAIERLEEARIGTIHSFCAELLRERPVEAGIDPAFRELDEEDAAALFRAAFDRWLQERLAAGSAVLRRALARKAGRADQSPTEALRHAGWCLAERRDYPTPWLRRPFERAHEADAMAARVAELAALLAQGPPGDPLRVALAPVSDHTLALERAERAAGRRDHDALEASLVDLSRRLARWTHQKKGGGRRYGPLERAAVVAERDRLVADLAAYRARAEADLAAELRAELAGAVERYEELKRREGRLDFLDLVLRTRDLLLADRDVRGWFQERFTHLFVDELQDTDPLQLETLLLLAADDADERDWRRVRPRPGKLFLVGDPKQSIYRFRRADVALYQELRDGLAERGVGVLGLTTSFRSLRPLQTFVNAAFAPEMTGDRAAAQAAYLPLDEYRPARPEQPAIVALPVPSPFRIKVSNEAIDASLPAATGAFLAWLLRDSGWTVADPEGGGAVVPVRAGHVALLFRQFASFGGDATRPFVEALEARGIPHVLLGSRSFHQREEVETLRAALEAIEHPDDELSVFATLKGSLFALPDEMLLRWRLESGPLHPFRRPPGGEPPAELAPVADALALLAGLHRGRNLVPLPETLHRLLAATRAHAGFALRPAGEQVLANVAHVADLARSFELKGGISFRGFVDRLAEEAESTAARQAPVVESGAEGVRLMTVHAAKGLEFPVVVLADLTSPLSQREPGEHADAARGLWAGRLLGCAPWELLEHAEGEARLAAAEGVRLAYVAATRARDLLVVPAVGVEAREGWLRPLNKAIYPPEERWHLAEPAPGCPPFGAFSVLDLPAGAGEPPPQVRPGLHRPAVGEHRVVWFDPARLELDTRGSFGLRQEEILREEGGEVAAAQGLLRAQAWERRRAAALAAGGRESLRLATVTEAARVLRAAAGDAGGDIAEPGRAEPGRGEPAGEPAIESVAREPDRPSGPRFGSLVHLVLRDAPLAADAEAVGRLAATHARLLLAPDEERDAAARAVLAALAHPLLRRAAAAEQVRREVPFALRTDARGGEGPPALVEGVLDLAFRAAGRWTLVDFKTEEGAGAREEYRRQLGWYAAALRAAGAEVGAVHLLLV